MVRRLACLAAAGLILGTMAGCLRSPATRFYTLMPVATPDTLPPAATKAASSVGIRSVRLPATLDRPQIATRTGAHTFAFSEFDRWSAPLDETVAHVMAENLAIRLGGEPVAVYPWPPRAVVDREVMVEISRFDGRLGGPCVLEARWRIVHKNASHPPIAGRSSATETAGADYPSLVAAHSRLIDALSADIAAALRRDTLTGHVR